MEFLETNFIWLLFPIMVIFIFVYKKATKNPDAITGKYVAEKTINGDPSENLKLIKEALKKH